MLCWIVAVPSGIAFDVFSDVRYRLLQSSVAHPVPEEEHERCLKCVHHSLKHDLKPKFSGV